jgi:hypothetical protein
MEEEKGKKIEKKAEKKGLDIRAVTICEATAQMLRKAERDGVETAFHRAADMKACPIGADSACCKHCSMGPCRLNSKDPYAKVGVCGATIDTIQARNFARMVASGAAAHTDHGMSMLDLFREVINGHITDYKIKDTASLKKWPGSSESRPRAVRQKKSPWMFTMNLSVPTLRLKERFLLPREFRKRPWKPGESTASFPGAP